MSEDDSRKDSELALDFINFTNEHIFLTGGAGTGKTFFLSNLLRRTYKKFAVCAPTGVAAVNAGGMTVHSLFNLPPRPLDQGTVSDIKLSGLTKKLLSELELLVIDEVSMLRADLLDAIDFLLQKERRNTQPFGGIQMLLIGDVFQLPPVPNVHDKAFLGDKYKSLFFFDSVVFRTLDIVVIELKQVYRQSEPVFIDILNKLRIDSMSQKDIDFLNSRYFPKETPKNTILLTTHNQSATELNEKMLSELSGLSYKFEALIDGDFADDLFPVSRVLDLKVGCQVMIIKNDKAVRSQIFNGKIGSLKSVYDDYLEIEFEDSTISVERETWQNIGFSVDIDQTSIQQEVRGTFRQFPVRLAWAITVHKSQGLSFQRAQVDLSRAFVSGQVYVALSRLRTIEGLYLASPISQSAIIRPSIGQFNLVDQFNPSIAKITLSQTRDRYMLEFLLKTFDWSSLQVTQGETGLSKAIEGPLIEAVTKLSQYAVIFCEEISNLLNSLDTFGWSRIYNRVLKSEEYFAAEINLRLLNALKPFIRQNSKEILFRSGVAFAREYSILCRKKIRSINNASRLLAVLVRVLKVDDAWSDLASARSPKATKRQEKLDNPESIELATEMVTFELFRSGVSISQIALQRGLGLSAVQNHLATFLPSGKVLLSDIIDPSILDNVLPLAQTLTNPTITSLRPLLADRLSIGEISALVTFLTKCR